MKSLLISLGVCASAFCAGQYEMPEPAAGSALPVEKVTPGAGPRVDHGIDAFITGSFIYWTARTDNIPYIKTGVGTGTTNVSKGSAKYPDWSWNPGFKAGIGLNLPHDGWDIYADYTWFYSSASDSTLGGGNGMLPTWDVSNVDSLLETPSTITEAKGAWDVHFYTVDLSLGRNYFVSRYLTLRPFVGFKMGWIDENLKVRYEVSNSTVDSTLLMKNDQDYWGIGLRSGLETAWHYDTNWSLYGNLALAGLWSQYQISRKDTQKDTRNGGGANSPPLNTAIANYNADNDFHTIKGVLELAIGLRGEWWFCESRYHFLVQAGWEEQLWINHNSFDERQFNITNHGDLVLQGLTLKLRFDF